MGIVKFGIGEILPDAIQKKLSEKFGQWTGKDQDELEQELSEESDDPEDGKSS